MNRDEIMKILPHRAPMLLVDEVELTLDGKACGYYDVRGDEYFLQGHFPGNPIVPGVIQCEMVAQSACVLFKDHMGCGVLPVYAGIDKVKFRRPIRPGERVELKAEISALSHPMYKLKGSTSVDGKLCMQGEFTIVLTDDKKEQD